MSWGVTSRWAVSVVGIVVTLFSVWFALDRFGDTVSQRNADRIKVGMKRKEVAEIMRRNADETSVCNLGEAQVWHNKTNPDMSLRVVFLFGENVAYSPVLSGDEERSTWSRFIHWIGW